jgi:hypothetical protein
MTRKLATVRKIDEIRPIAGADAIEAAVVGGWTVVVKRGEYTAGDLAVYLEIDSWVPTELASFLSKGGEPREFNGVRGERLRSIKLKGQISQGLLLPMSVLNWDTNSIDVDDIGYHYNAISSTTVIIGNDVLFSIFNQLFCPFGAETNCRVIDINGSTALFNNTTNY